LVYRTVGGLGSGDHLDAWARLLELVAPILIE